MNRLELMEAISRKVVEEQARRDQAAAIVSLWPDDPFAGMPAPDLVISDILYWHGPQPKDPKSARPTIATITIGPFGCDVQLHGPSGHQIWWGMGREQALDWVRRHILGEKIAGGCLRGSL